MVPYRFPSESDFGMVPTCGEPKLKIAETKKTAHDEEVG